MSAKFWVHTLHL